MKSLFYFTYLEFKVALNALVSCGHEVDCWSEKIDLKDDKYIEIYFIEVKK